MFRVICFIALGLSVLSSAAAAEQRTRLGYGRLIQNDFIGDGQDRWRTGNVVSSRVWGMGWDDELPTAFGDILEFRLNAEIMAPDNLVAPAAGDRPFAGSLSFGIHTHFQRQTLEYAMGLDMVMTGPSTLLGDFQTGLHDALGIDSASDATLDGQVGNGLHPTLVFEVGRTLDLSDRMSLRPFLEARAGAETMLRAGADLSIGSVGRGELLVRDPASGQRYRVIQNQDQGVSFVIGGDIAAVSDSIYLPAGEGYTLTDSRNRLRAGVHWQGEASSVFYGLTWLGEEFTGQDEGQFVGSLRLNLDF